MPDASGEHRLQVLPVLALVLLVLLLLVVLTNRWLWPGLGLSVEPTSVMATIAPLLLTAGFIERAVEVVISPWRDGEAERLQKQADRSRASQSPTAVADEHALHHYRAQTKQYAFAVALGFGLAAAVAGVRALGAFAITDPGKTGFSGADPMQRKVFIVVDILLSALLLAGGANGIHSVVNAFTSYFDSTAQLNSQKANQAAPPTTATATTQVTVLGPVQAPADAEPATAGAAAGS